MAGCSCRGNKGISFNREFETFCDSARISVTLSHPSERKDGEQMQRPEQRRPVRTDLICEANANRGNAMLVQVNESVIRICSDGRLAITSRGARMLGMTFPLKGGWKRRMMGRCVDIPDELIDAEQRAKLDQHRPGIIPTGGNWKPAHPGKSPVIGVLVESATCRTCNALRAAGISVTFDVGEDMLAVQSLRSGKVTKIRGCDLND